MQITPLALRALAHDIQLPISYQWGGKNRDSGNVTKNRLEAFCWGNVNGILKGKCRIEISYIHLRKIAHKARPEILKHFFPRKLYSMLFRIKFDKNSL